MGVLASLFYALCPKLYASPLDLLVLGVGLANDADLALAADDLAGAADLLDTGLDLHGNPPSGRRGAGLTGR